VNLKADTCALKKEDTMRRGASLVSLAALTTTLILAGCGAGGGGDSITPEEVRSITEEAYIFSFPILDSYKMLFAQALYPDSATP